jgi:hypothetical protein
MFAYKDAKSRFQIATVSFGKASIVEFRLDSRMLSEMGASLMNFKRTHTGEGMKDEG